MAENPTAAVLTQDIANRYQIEVGDTIRALKEEYDMHYFSFSVIVIVDSLTHPVIPESTYIPEDEGYVVGSRKIWINSMYAQDKLDLVDNTYSYLALATNNECNDTELALDLLESGG
jgi:hypothetical protein